MATLAALSLAILVFIYAGYPLLLALIVRVRGPRAVRTGSHLPSVSLVISAYNEADVIRIKLENTAALDYPRDLLQVVVISDASDDGTDEIAAEYTASHGVIVARQPERAGKTAGLNRTVPTLRGDIVVFSDANAMYKRNALKMLVRNFADPQVGCVTGQAKYVEGGDTAADAGERTYWNYEIAIKKLETALGSTVGGDGAIYAIRAFLWQTLPSSGINDFLNPLQIVNAGWRAIYEPDAICYEDTAGTPGRDIPPPRAYRQSQLARGLPGARRAQSLSHRMVRLLAGLAQDAALAHWRIRRRCRSRRGRDDPRERHRVATCRRWGRRKQCRRVPSDSPGRSAGRLFLDHPGGFPGRRCERHVRTGRGHMVASASDN